MSTHPKIKDSGVINSTPLVKPARGVRKRSRTSDFRSRLRHQQSDARWRASLANCYTILSAVVERKREYKRRPSKAVILQETFNHVQFLEDAAETLLKEKAKQDGHDIENVSAEYFLEYFKKEFAQCIEKDRANRNQNKRPYRKHKRENFNDPIKPVIIKNDSKNTQKQPSEINPAYLAYDHCYHIGSSNSEHVESSRVSNSWYKELKFPPQARKGRPPIKRGPVLTKVVKASPSRCVESEMPTSQNTQKNASLKQETKEETHIEILIPATSVNYLSPSIDPVKTCDGVPSYSSKYLELNGINQSDTFGNFCIQRKNKELSSTNLLKSHAENKIGKVSCKRSPTVRTSSNTKNGWVSNSDETKVNDDGRIVSAVQAFIKKEIDDDDRTRSATSIRPWSTDLYLSNSNNKTPKHKDEMLLSKRYFSHVSESKHMLSPEVQNEVYEKYKSPVTGDYGNEHSLQSFTRIVSPQALPTENSPNVPSLFCPEKLDTMILDIKEQTPVLFSQQLENRKILFQRNELNVLKRSKQFGNKVNSETVPIGQVTLVKTNEVKKKKFQGNIKQQRRSSKSRNLKPTKPESTEQKIKLGQKLFEKQAMSQLAEHLPANSDHMSSALSKLSVIWEKLPFNHKLAFSSVAIREKISASENGNFCNGMMEKNEYVKPVPQLSDLNSAISHNDHSEELINLFKLSQDDIREMEKFTSDLEKYPEYEEIFNEEKLVFNNNVFSPDLSYGKKPHKISFVKSTEKYSCLREILQFSPSQYVIKNRLSTTCRRKLEYDDELKDTSIEVNPATSYSLNSPSYIYSQSYPYRLQNINKADQTFSLDKEGNIAENQCNSATKLYQELLSVEEYFPLIEPDIITTQNNASLVPTQEADALENYLYELDLFSGDDTQEVPNVSLLQISRSDSSQENQHLFLVPEHTGEFRSALTAENVNDKNNFPSSFESGRSNLEVYTQSGLETANAENQEAISNLRMLCYPEHQIVPDIEMESENSSLGGFSAGFSESSSYFATDTSSDLSCKDKNSPRICERSLTFPEQDPTLTSANFSVDKLKNCKISPSLVSGEKSNSIFQISEQKEGIQSAADIWCWSLPYQFYSNSLFDIDCQESQAG